VTATRAPVRPRLILGICCFSIFMVGLDVTILNVALPQIQGDLHASVSGAQWTIDAYTLVIACLLLLAGSTADRIGRRRTFQFGLTTFTVGSLLCSLAPSLGWLIAFRGVQAVGGSMLNPVALSIISTVFTEPHERARAYGVWGGIAGISIASGPLLGGVLVDGIGWRSIFWINVPVGIAAFVLAAMFVPESRAAHARRPDIVGQGLVIGALVLLVYGIIEAPASGWGSPEIIACFLVSAACFATLIPYELRRREPLVDPRFFRSAPFTGAVVIAVCAFTAMGGFLFLNTLYLQDVRGYSALHAGLAVLPMASLWALFGPISGRVLARWGPRLPLVLGGLGFLGGGLVSAIPSGEPPDSRLLLSYVLLGIGIGWVNAPITNKAVSGMPGDQAGLAAAIASTSRQLGSALGVAIVGTVIAAHVSVVSAGDAFLDAARTSWWIIAVLGLLIFVVGLVTSGGWARGTAQRNADPTPAVNHLPV
jgi:EmrB/QacA subfamily drug resistance transporter